MPDIGFIILLLGAWAASTISGVAGFGGALLLLPLVAYVVGAKTAVPVLTLAQLLGNLSRSAFGWREIAWKPVLLFSLGAVPTSVLGAFLFVELPPGWITKLIGLFLIVVVAFRHTPRGKKPLSLNYFLPAGAIVGFLSALVGSAGPLGAVVFLGLHLPPTSYIASEAVTASLIHLSKSIIYKRYSLFSFSDLMLGLAMGGAMILGSWTGRKLIQRLPGVWFASCVEILLILSAISLLIK